jgi:acyl carrier protein
VLARNRAVMETLSERVGVTPVDARKSLDLMAEALGAQGSAADDAVIAIAAMHWGKARERLATLKSPSYAGLGSEQQAEAGGAQAISIPSLLRSLDIDEVRKVVTEAIVEDVARILRLPKDDVSRVRQLSEIGLDSLMGVELGASLQERFGLEAPPAGVSSGQTVTELADTLIQSVAAPVDEAAAAVLSLAQRHAGESLDASQLDPLQALVEEKSREIKVIL